MYRVAGGDNKRFAHKYSGTGVLWLFIADNSEYSRWLAEHWSHSIWKLHLTFICEYSFSDCPDLTLGVWFGSYGHEYAQSHNIPYILLDSVLLGDANGDGYVNISDVTDIQRVVAEMDTLDDLRKKAADINGDGVVTIDDATFLQTYLAEFETAYPIGEVV